VTARSICASGVSRRARRRGGSGLLVKGALGKEAWRMRKNEDWERRLEGGCEKGQAREREKKNGIACM